MAKLVALYKKPADPAKFDAYYYATHAPLARSIPGLLRYEVSTGSIDMPQGDSPYHLVATLTFASLDSVKAGLDSPAGQATANDLGNFADAGVDLLMFDSKEL